MLKNDQVRRAHILLDEFNDKLRESWLLKKKIVLDDYTCGELSDNLEILLKELKGVRSSSIHNYSMES